MKTLQSILILVAAMNGAVVASAQNRSEQPPFQVQKWSREQVEVWRTVESWNDAFEANQVDLYFSYIDPEITVLTPSSPFRVDGIAADRREFVFSLTRGSGRVAFFQELQPHVAVFGDVAYATYYNRGWYGPEGEEKLLQLRETDILKRTRSGWKIAHIHVSVAK